MIKTKNEIKYDVMQSLISNSYKVFAQLPRNVYICINDINIHTLIYIAVTPWNLYQA